MTSRLERACAAIDAVNAGDPHEVRFRATVHPLAQVHGVLATEWLQRLRADADEAMVLAARAHHLRRWALARGSYPEGRAGYLRWRKDQKLRHAVEVAVLLRDVGYGDDVVLRTQALIRRDNLATDRDAQTMEDVACLVFLETQLVDMAARTDAHRMDEIIRKTAAKMTTQGRDAVAVADLDPRAKALVDRALTTT